MVYLPKLHVAKELCTTLLIKWLSNVRRNDFIGNNSWVSIDRPKQANSRDLTLKEESLCESVINNVAHLKQQKRHVCNVMLVAIRFIKV